MDGSIDRSMDKSSALV